MRFIVADWGTTRFRGYLIENETVLDQVSSEEGVSALRQGQHRDVFLRQCGSWLQAEPDAPVLLVGMVGSREGWVEAPYASCPAGPAEIAQALVPVDLGNGRKGYIIPGLFCEPASGAADVMRGEETLAMGTGIEDGLICSAGTHPKWILMKNGRVERFATFMTGEMYALLREHSMIGRPATEPQDPRGFDRGLDAAERNAGEARAGLLHLLFSARASVVSNRMHSSLLAPYLSGLLTGDEINGALSQFGRPSSVTILAAPERAELYVHALERHGIRAEIKDTQQALIAGLARIVRQHSSA
ncbi:2-dehydro-3-deoxygalactonokinase [Microvirga arsenatis]|uniref:2-dehydro-3-deoxygalactonokinase n=1 Tax=Microvirga arsenatis TaxID=2692265 RepID=A0ABW9YXE0_9HYPH|nr:2-dehydro-3-deoxygalactonokinase [Microvirga arsenatis]NBJ11763.1 2-dehydro-3-deoxygalactonokinase [Microvirga arsenatis]NBJ25044.1 2-dehydro-3-deoxygalactonokinase [Microvirga arsenatis]